jgi:peptidoglycan/LPS O-acetylase OafA/YrhL
MNQQEAAATWRLLSFPLYLVHWPTLFGPAALFCRTAWPELNWFARALLLPEYALRSSPAYFFAVDRRALELSRGLRKRVSDATLETPRVATVGVDRVVRVE